MKHTREIAAIALPAIVSNITTPILSLVDVAISGHIGAAVFIGAIALGGTVFNILYWLFNFLRMGTSGPTAQAYGAGDMRGTSLVLWRSLAVAAAIGLFLLVLGHPLGRCIIRFMDADDATLQPALRYFNICIWGAPAVMATYSLGGWFTGMQNTRAPMWIAISTNVVNIALSTTAVFGLGLGIEGIAIGTTTAQWFGALLALLIAMRRYRPAHAPLREIFQRGSLVAFFRINTDIFLRTSCLVAVTLWFTHAGAAMGVGILAANALLLQLFMLFSFFMDGFANAGEALAGKYHGASDSKSLSSLIRELMRIGVLFATVFTLLYASLGIPFMRLLADDPSVVDTARRYLPWAVAVPACSFAAFIWDGILVGLTRTRIMLAAMAVAMIAFFTVYFAMRHQLGNDSLWLAFCSYLFLRGFVSYLLQRRKLRQHA